MLTRRSATRSAPIARGTRVARAVAASIGACVVALGVATGPVAAADDPVTVTGDNRRSVDIRVRDDGRGTAPRNGPRRPAAADAPEAWDKCLERNTSDGVLCLAAAGGSLGMPPVGVTALAIEARSRLTLPLPAPSLRPLVRFADGAVGGLTGTPTWLWTDPAHWAPTGAPLVREARAGAVRAVVRASPVRVVWRPGDGTVVVCRGPGTPLAEPVRGPAGSPDCGHTYRRTSAARPDGRYRVTVGVTWAVTWAGSDGSSGVLAPLGVTTTVSYAVREGRVQLVSP